MNTKELIRTTSSRSLTEKHQALENAFEEMEQEGKPEPLRKAACEKVEAVEREMEDQLACG